MNVISYVPQTYGTTHHTTYLVHHTMSYLCLASSPDEGAHGLLCPRGALLLRPQHPKAVRELIAMDLDGVVRLNLEVLPDQLCWVSCKKRAKGGSISSAGGRQVDTGTAQNGGIPAVSGDEINT